MATSSYSVSVREDRGPIASQVKYNERPSRTRGGRAYVDITDSQGRTTSICARLVRDNERNRPLIRIGDKTFVRKSFDRRLKQDGGFNKEQIRQIKAAITHQEVTERGQSLRGRAVAIKTAALSDVDHGPESERATSHPVARTERVARRFFSKPSDALASLGIVVSKGVIGKGANGSVQEGVWGGRRVVIKTIKHQRERINTKDLSGEAFALQLHKAGGTIRKVDAALLKNTLWQQNNIFSFNLIEKKKSFLFFFFLLN